jgi:DNA repair exonuclease SbcCD nuclease subunit
MISIADVHLGKTNDSFIIDGVPSQTIDVEHRLYSILDLAKGPSKQWICVAGDIFNRVNPSTQVISILFKWLAACKEADVNVVIIPGNHDSGVEWTNMTMLQNAELDNVQVITTPQILSIQETSLSGDNISRDILFWPHLTLSDQEQAEKKYGSISKAIAAQFPKSEMIVTHGQIETPIINEDGKASESYQNEIFFEAGNAMKIEPGVFKKLKLLILGHVHNHTFSRDRKWVYPGSLTINNFGEVDESKGYLSIDLETLEWKWTEWPDDITPWVHVELDLTNKDESSLDETAIQSLVQGAIIKITVLAKRHGVVDESKIRTLFNQYGYVSRFETKIAAIDDRPSDKTDKKFSHIELLETWLNKTDEDESIKSLALSMGTRIIEEVNQL